MFLYELAIELDQRSVDLAEAAAELGMDQLGPTSTLDAQQVMALRSRFGRGSVPPPPPRPGHMPLPSVPTAPLAFGMPGSPAPAAPSAPATWGAPVAPPDWGPPPAPPPGAAVPPQPEPEPMAPPISGLGDAFIPPPPTMPPPPPTLPPPGTTKVHAGGFHPGGGIPADDDDGMSKGQIAALIAVGILVVGLFAFMVANTGPDKKREQKIAASETEVLDDPASTIPLETTTAEGTDPTGATTAPAATAPLSTTPRDEAAVCAGFRQLAPILLILGDSASTTSTATFDQTKRAVAQQRPAVEGGLRQIAAGVAPSQDAAVQELTFALTAYLNGMATSDTAAELEASAPADQGGQAVVPLLDDLLARCS